MKIKSIFVMLLLSLSLSAQNKDKDGKQEENYVRGLYTIESSANISCDKLSEESGYELLDRLMPRLFEQIKEAFQLDSSKPITYLYVKNSSFAYAVSRGFCNTRGKGKRLILIGTEIIDKRLRALKELANNNYQSLNPSFLENEKEFSLVAVLAHEMAHFKQTDLNLRADGIEDKEMELHADFLAGWYLARYAKQKGLERTVRLQSTISAISKFYMLGEDTKPNVTYGTPENRLQITLDGLQSTAEQIRVAYPEGINVINRNPIYHNPPDKFGAEIKTQVEKFLVDKSSFSLQNTKCKISTAFRRNTIGCELIKSETETNSYFNKVTEGVLSYLPKKSELLKGTTFTKFSVKDPYFPVRNVTIQKTQTGVNFFLIIFLPDSAVPKKVKETNKGVFAKEIQNKIQTLARNSTKNGKASINIWGKACRVDGLPNETWQVICEFTPENAGHYYKQKKKAVFDWLPLDFRFTERNEDENEKFEAWNYSSVPVKQISLTRLDTTVFLSIQVDGNVPSENIVTQSRTLNSLGEKFKELTEKVSSSIDSPNFIFQNSKCLVLFKNFAWHISCDILPDPQKQETLSSVYKEVRDALWSWSPKGRKERESNTTYENSPSSSKNVTPNSQIVELVKVSKLETKVLLRVRVDMRNPNIKTGKPNAEPDAVGRELFNQIKKLTETSSDDIPSFTLFGKECEVNPSREVVCNVKIKRKKLFDGVVSILNKEWKYIVDTKASFISMKTVPNSCLANDKRPLCKLKSIIIHPGLEEKDHTILLDLSTL